MTDDEAFDVQALLDALPRCYTYGGEGSAGWGEQCLNIATMAHPTVVIGDHTLRCAEHPGAPENDYGERAHPTRWAPVVTRLAAQGFRMARLKEAP